MSLLFVDSFDHYTTILDKWTSEGGSASIGSSGARYGAGGYVVGTANNATKYARKNFGGTATTVVVGAAFRLGDTPSGTLSLISLMEGATNHVDVRVTTAQKLRITRNGTQLGSDGTTVLSLNIWYYLEFKAFLNDATGTAQLKIDGVTELNLTSQDTRNAGTPLADTVQLAHSAGVTNTPMHFDDLYVCNIAGSVNNDFLGDIRVAALLPSGAGSTTQWTPSAGSNYQNVDETPPDDDTTYNSTSTASNKDTFAMGNLPSAASTVHGIQEGTRHRKDDAGSRTLRQVVRSGGTDYEGGDIAVGDSYAYTFSIRETDPNTSAAWTGTNIDALEAGYKLQA